MLRLPPPVAVQAVEVGAHLKLMEGAAQVHVREDEIRLGRLVGAAEEHRVGPLADELDPVEIADDGVHRQRQHALPLKQARGGGGDRLQLVVLEREAELPQLLAELRPGAGRGVRHEPQPVAVPTELLDRLDCPRDRLPRDV